MGRYKRGDFVKVEVRDEASGENEWLWVLVDNSDDERRLVFGKLDNEPIVHTKMRLGMELAVSYDNIRDHRTAASFKQ
jgi:hypothetical protein